jgi:hypothetical protein
VCVSDFAQNSRRWELRLKTAFQEEALSHEKVTDWLHCYKDGCTSTESDRHSGYPSSSGNDEVIATVHDLMIAVQIITIREVAEGWGISFGSC